MANVSNPSTNRSVTMTGAPARGIMIMAAAAVALMVVLSLGVSRAGAVDYPPPTDPPPTEVTVVPGGGGDDDIIEAGEPVEFISTGWEPGTVATMTIVINGETITLTTIVNENGEAIFDWTVPAGTNTGDYGFAIEGIDEVTGEPRVAAGDIHIEAEGAFVPGDGGGGALPYTGSNSSNLIRIGIVLVAAGGISVFAVRRRNAHVDA
jgi:LPXTG-motif cell wall-anchored protein